MFSVYKKWPAWANKAEFEELSESMSMRELAIHYGKSKASIQSLAGLLKHERLSSVVDHFPSTAPDPVGDPPSVVADKVLVIGDAEIPHHSTAMFDLAARCASHFDIKTLIINGDFVAMDVFSEWHKPFVYSLAFDEEIDPALQTIQLFLKMFNEITWVTGNHERRLVHKLDGHITLGHFFKKISGLTFSEHAHVLLNPGKNQTLICHQDNYSRIPLSVPRELCAINHCNILCGHTHHMCWGWDRSGKYWIAEGGHCRQNAAYKALRVNTHPAWHPGFVMIFNNQPQLVTPHNASFYLDAIKMR